MWAVRAKDYCLQLIRIPFTSKLVKSLGVAKKERAINTVYLPITFVTKLF